MKEIKAVIQPSELPALHDALLKLPGFPGMTVSRVEGCSGHSCYIQPPNFKEELTDSTDKIRLEIVAPDEEVVAILNCIIQVGQTGHIGDGLVWMTDVEYGKFINTNSA